MGAICLLHFEHLDILMVFRDIVPLFKLKAKKVVA